MRFLIVITARGGSKGIPKKNIRELCGKPLICYSLDVAMKLCPVDDICVSTDDEEIVSVVENYGVKVPFRRPAELSTDDAGQYDVVRHAYNYYLSLGRKYDCIVLLQPTTPLRNVSDTKKQIDSFMPDSDMVVSVCKASANPYFVLFEEDDKGFLVKSKEGNFKRRQDCPPVWQYNGSCYVINPDSLLRYNSFNEFKRIRKFVMSSADSVDIDDELDWDFCEFLIMKSGIKKQ
ncbi:MAG TPA: acylneuraminate cytidylyltransferase family protein [Bacteroidales bacterium]|nr:acylneuraminate cytidylyltransferase family protein [Bacteroidales bacterium]HPT11019.1 acylneuraminate cytidylyltransferase family protein [Bacteroidales bacterium]